MKILLTAFLLVLISSPAIGQNFLNSASVKNKKATLAYFVYEEETWWFAVPRVGFNQALYAGTSVGLIQILDHGYHQNVAGAGVGMEYHFGTSTPSVLIEGVLARHENLFSLHLRGGASYHVNSPNTNMAAHICPGAGYSIVSINYRFDYLFAPSRGQHSIELAFTIPLAQRN